MTGSWKGRGNQYIEFARVLYCKLPTNGKELPALKYYADLSWLCSVGTCIVDFLILD